MVETTQSPNGQTTQTDPVSATTQPNTNPISSTTTPTEPSQSLLNEPEKTVEAPQAAPETYTDFKVPEGYQLDKTMLGEASALFKEQGLSQEGAQKLVDFYVKQSQAAQLKPFEAYQQMRKDWRGQAETKYGQQLPEVKAVIGRAIGILPVELQTQMRAAMDLTGAGDNPAIIEALHIWAKAATEGRPVNAPLRVEQGKPNGRPSAAQAMYPNNPSSMAS